MFPAPRLRKGQEHLPLLTRWNITMIDKDAVAQHDTGLLRDRTDAGQLIAPLVAALAPSDPVVLALPRGGVPVAAPVAGALGAPLDLLVVRKLGLPTNPEHAFGALGEHGEPLIDYGIVAAADLLDHEVEQVVTRERRELARRIGAYRENNPALDVTGKSAILVDDGAATGSTALAAIAVARSLGAASVTVAVGAAPPDVLELLDRHADHALATITPEPFWSVGQWYRDFAPVEEREVLAILNARR